MCLAKNQCSVVRKKRRMEWPVLLSQRLFTFLISIDTDFLSLYPLNTFANQSKGLFSQLQKKNSMNLN